MVIIHKKNYSIIILSTIIQNKSLPHANFDTFQSEILLQSYSPYISYKSLVHFILNLRNKVICFGFSFLAYIQLYFQIQNMKRQPEHDLNIHNYKSEVKKLTSPHKQMIVKASDSLKRKFLSYKISQSQKKSLQIENPIYHHQQRTNSLLSEITNSQYYQEPAQAQPPPQVHQPKVYELSEWRPASQNGFKDISTLVNYYNQIFNMKKFMLKNRKNRYDFKQDEKQLLVKIFEEIKSEQNYVSFDKIVAFFQECKLFYLYYNIKPHQLLDILKDFAHQHQDKLSMIQFLNVFFIDRPNIIGFQDKQDRFVNKRCVLSQQNWKQLKAIFSTLDTFGNEQIHFTPFIYKVKNNLSNIHLINQPAIQYPEIKRTIPVKKVIFNIEYRHEMAQKIKWSDIQNMFTNFIYKQEPTIDTIYNKMIERGDISKFSNYFMLKPEILHQIKGIYYRCPKYCQYFVKTKFVCRQMLQSPSIKKIMKQAVVRIIQNGSKSYYVSLEEQIRNISNQAQNYIDLDELLEYFSIKGPINTTAQAQIQWNSTQSSDEQNQARLTELSKAKSLQKIKQYSSYNKGHKFIRHLTLCNQFNLTKKKGETIMQRKTRQMRQKKQQQEDAELKKKFKSNPIPVQLNQERYKEYVKKMEDQKQLKKQQFEKKREEQNKIYQYLKTNTSIFNKKQPQQPSPMPQHKFTPKPIPWFVTEVYMLQKINESKQLRKKKLQTEAKLRMMKEWKKLPDLMKQYSQPSQDQDNKISQQQSGDVRPKSKVKQVPNFKQLQKQFQQQLQKRKQNFKTTQPKEFNLSTSKPKGHSIQKIENNNKLQNVKSPVKHKTSVQTCIAKDKVQIPTTIKFQQMVNFTHQKLNNQLKQMQRALSEERNRVQKQQNFAKYMRSKLKQSLRKSNSLQDLVRVKSKNLHQSWKNLQKQNEQQLCRMYSNVMNRPFLFESQDVFQNSRENNVTQHTQKPSKLKKKNRNAKQKGKNKVQKHIHQSPLKQFEAEPFQGQKKTSPMQEHMQSEHQFQPYLNQSF